MGRKPKTSLHVFFVFFFVSVGTALKRRVRTNFGVVRRDLTAGTAIQCIRRRGVPCLNRGERIHPFKSPFSLVPCSSGRRLERWSLKIPLSKCPHDNGDRNGDKHSCVRACVLKRAAVLKRKNLKGAICSDLHIRTCTHTPPSSTSFEL